MTIMSCFGDDVPDPVPAGHAAYDKTISSASQNKTRNSISKKEVCFH